MKLVKTVFVGILMWGTSLIWPGINQWLTHGVMLVSVAGLGSLIAGYLLFRPRRQPNNNPPPSVLKVSKSARVM